MRAVITGATGGIGGATAEASLVPKSIHPPVLATESTLMLYI